MLNQVGFCLGHKIHDATAQFAPIATLSDPFGQIHKLHTQLHMWNHARTFTWFHFLSYFHKAEIPYICSMGYVNTAINGPHVNNCFHMCDCVCYLQMRQNGSLHVVIGVNRTVES